MTDLICVPLKKSSDVDIVKPLKNIIASLYSTADNPEDFSTDIQELSYMRTQALSKTLDKSTAALDLLYKYYDQLSSLENKIPPQEVQIAFKWKDAFDKGGLFGGRVSLSVSSLAYEKVCVMFNIAALQSQIGAHTRIGESDGDMKSAAKLFQQASGIFAHLKMAPTTMGGQEPTPDLSGDTVTALSALMLAQAQEIFVKKAIADKMKDATVARLCIQCEDMYADALKQLQRDTVKHNWDKDWIPTVAGKQAAYSALAQYFQSQVCAEKKQVGEQITRLMQTMEILKQAQQRSGNTTFFSDYVNKANRLLTQAKKDNDFIYHERVLEASALTPVEKVASARIAKVLPLSEKMCEHYSKDLFANMVPVQVHQAIATCEVRKTEMTGGKINQLREANALLNSILASLNLPAALEDSQGDKDEVPVSLKEKAKCIQEAGGYTELISSVQEIPELVQRNKEILDEAERILREEEESDQQLRAQLKEKWTRTSSDKLNATFKTNAARYREIINNALAADEVVRGKMATHEQAIQMLSRGENGLGDVLPKSSNTAKSSTGSLSARENLKALMTQVEGLKREREALENSLKNVAFDMKTPFLKALAQDGAINEPAMSVEMLGRAIGPLEDQVKTNLEAQEGLILSIQHNSDEYFGKKDASSDTLSRRDAMMRQLAEGYDAFTDLQSNIKEGRKFYNDLTQLLVAFQNKISDFCFARKTEKEELLRDVTRDASSGGSAGVASPPPRPPQPNVAPATAAAAPQQYHQQPYNPGAPPAYPGAGQPQVSTAQQQQHPGAPSLPYPVGGYPQSMPMPFPQQQPLHPMQPYPFTPMPATFNPYATFPLPSHYPYPQQQMGYNPYGYPPNQQQQQPPPQ